jgi:peptidoglycan hydrolase-like protein with peptidoglycan-binding domain
MGAVMNWHKVRLAALLTLPASALIAYDGWRWRWFIHPDFHLAREAAQVLLSGDGLRVYAEAPLAQMGPLALALAPLPHAAYNVVVALLVLPFLVLAARPLLEDDVQPSRRITWLLATTLLIAPWAQLAWKGHGDDALVLLGAAVMLTALAARRTIWVLAGWFVAVAGKPTALALAPLLLATPATLWLGPVLAAMVWLPFFIADPGAMARAGQGVMAVVPGDGLSYLGVRTGRPPAWVRPLQLAVAWVGTLLGHLRARPAAGLLAGLALRAALEPNPAPAYSISLVAIALFVDAGRRLPVATGLAALGFWTSQMVLDGGSGLPRLALLLGLVAWCVWTLTGRALDLVGVVSGMPWARVARAGAALAIATAWVSGPASPVQASDVIQRGSVGLGVKCVQYAVNHLGSAGVGIGLRTPVDGQYGRDTAGAVQALQASFAPIENFESTVDGRVGTLTGTTLREANFGGAPAEWRCDEHVPYDPKLRRQAQANLSDVAFNT